MIEMHTHSGQLLEQIIYGDKSENISAILRCILLQIRYTLLKVCFNLSHLALCVSILKKAFSQNYDLFIVYGHMVGMRKRARCDFAPLHMRMQVTLSWFGSAYVREYKSACVTRY